MATTIKKTGSFQGQPNTLGGGGRFKQMVASGKSPALAAFIGRKIYSKSKFQKMATTGKKSDSEGATDKMDKNESAENESKKKNPMMPPKGIAVGNPNAIRTN